MNRSKVSIVICTYNQQAFVRETVESVLAQTYPNIEIIVTDDGSSDDTPRILRSLVADTNKPQLCLSERNTGIPSNINRGLARVTGDLLVILDGDDLMLPDKIQRQVTFLDEHPGATGCYHDAEVFDSETGKTLGRMSELYNGRRALLQGHFSDWFIPRHFFLPSAIMSRRSAVPVHGFDERMKYLSEVVFYADVYHAGTLLAIDEVLVKYRRHASNITGSPAAREKMYEYELMAYAILEARYPELYPLLRQLRLSCMLTNAIKAKRGNDPVRLRRILVNVAREGAPVKALLVFVGLVFLGRHNTVELTGGPTYTRPGWIKRFAQHILR